MRAKVNSCSYYYTILFLFIKGVTVFTPMKELGVKYNTKIAINGIGGLGHVAIRIARAMGATVTAISTRCVKGVQW